MVKAARHFRFDLELSDEAGVLFTLVVHEFDDRFAVQRFVECSVQSPEAAATEKSQLLVARAGRRRSWRGFGGGLKGRGFRQIAQQRLDYLIHSRRPVREALAIFLVFDL